MTTYQTIITDVQNIVIDLPATVQAAVAGLVQDAAIDFQSRGYTFWINKAATDTFITAADTRVLAAIPSNFLELNGKPYVLRKDGSVFEMTTSFDYTDNYGTFQEDSTGEPRVLVFALSTADVGLTSSNFEVWPLSDGASDYTVTDGDEGEYRVIIPYKRVLNDYGLSNQDWLTNSVYPRQFITYKAASDAFARDWDYESQSVWLSQAEVAFKRAVKQDKMLRLSGADLDLVPKWQGGNTTRLRS